MTGLRILFGLALRRDRVMLPAWVLGLGAAVLVTSTSYADLYKDPASRREVVTTLGETPATLALYGRIYADSVGGLVGWRLGGIALALAGLMTILLVTRHTRADEETGRAELLGATVVDRRAPLAAALLVATTASLALGVVVTLAVLAAGGGDATASALVDGATLASAATSGGTTLADTAALAAATTGGTALTDTAALASAATTGGTVFADGATLVFAPAASAGTGIDLAGALALGATFAAVGLAFAGVAAVTAQVTDSSRSANGLAVGVLGAAFAIRALGDAGPHWLSWLSPIGWGQQVRALAENRWPVLLLPLALAAILTVVATVLHARRDLGAGLFPPRPGPPRGALATPLQLAFRLQRGALVGWAAGFAILGAAFGSIAQDIGDVIGDSTDVKHALQTLGGQQDLVDAYLSATFGILALIAAAYAIQAVLRLRGEETSGRAEPILATATSRTRWALSHASIAFAGVALLLAAAGLAAGLGHAAQTGDANEIPRLTAAALTQAPAAWVLAALALALFGAIPKGTAAAWGALALALALVELGPLADLPQTLIDVSPFAHSPQLPGGELGAGPILNATLAAGLAAAGLYGLRRRDLTSS
ncbi:ABC transporter permease [Solirubrobacter phytolaccae]|uniref:ABC transporter permease n=1 Tax=Solirubrobacter phytolaccae TaxID=1404360 RepID=A0A9X3N6Y7_9ACTN|nr:ABC transporter permease [Solirubrobacter phytolaccae]MDA0180863.1 ABC transporter permease [Solirubrobacter phytolaccae]